MAADKYVAPKLNVAAFHCPLCGVYSNQVWEDAKWFRGTQILDITYTRTAMCAHCKKFSLWYGEKMILPSSGTAPLPHPAMPPDVLVDYNEARDIVSRSPRGSAALLRLCVQKLCKDLGLPGKNIDDDIGELVKRGLPPLLQKALDTVRVTGNESVHPGELDMRDNTELAGKLFGLVNLIVEKMIAEPKEIEALYGTLPEKKLEAIQRRDAPKG